MTSAIYDFEAIRRAEEERKAEQDLALTGSTLEEPKVGEVAFGWAYNPADYDPA